MSAKIRQADGETESAPHVLNSWKEIAAYLGRGRRTVQRWEREFGLPVHRPNRRRRSAVVADPKELDAWLSRAPKLVELRRATHAQPAYDRLRKNTELLAQRAAELVEKATKLYQQLDRALQATRAGKPATDATGILPNKKFG